MDQKDDFIDPRGEEDIPRTVASVGPPYQLGSAIGPYKLLRILGEGGFGIVYLAEQERPIRRQVALKIIKPGMDSAQIIRRFEAERQALALLDHPNIAHVYDARTTETGRPYFAMEYVKGVPITEHCDRLKLTVEERLRLFVQICEAIQHAHQKGIIHRDIKPSNVQVCIQGELAVPKVIDFGVAKALSQPLVERTLVTEQGQLIGTPEYMSPEQAEMTNQDIDTRSDIYSLGVLLYGLLTGTLPFESETLRRGSLEQMRQIIRESRRRVLGPDHADTLETSVWLGLVYAELPKLDEAEQLLATALESCNRLLGERDPITLEAMYGLAFLRIVQDRVDDAKPLGFRGWEISRNVLGEGHRLTLDFMNQVAWFEALDHKFDEAELHAKTALEANQRVLGKEHPQTIVTMGTLGQVYAVQGKRDLAEPLLTESVSLGRRVLGRSNLWVLFHGYLLGCVHTGQDRYGEADSVFKEVLADSRRDFSEDNVVLRETIRAMRRLYAAWGKSEEAEKWLAQWRAQQPPESTPPKR